MRQSMTPLVAGLLIGCGGALAMGSVLASLLFSVRPNDPLVIGGVVPLVGGVGLLASAAAAGRSLRIDPVAALRDE